MTFIDFFAGIGGFRRGMEMAGHKCIGFCEFDKYAVASYTSMHLITEEQREYLSTLDMKKRQKEILKDEYRNGEWYASDVRTVRAEDIPRADCWCFGFPCQDISVAGKQLGFAGHRSSLFFAVTKLVRDLEEEDRPTYLFIENVKNLLSVNGGFDFAKLLIEMDEIGYDAEWAVLNSKDFGVPQNRERVFIIGHLRGRSGGEIFPVEGTDGEDCVPVCLNSKGGRNGMPGLQPSIKDRVYDPTGIMPTVATSDFFNPNVAVPICNINPSGNGMNGVVYDGCGLAPALTTNKGEGNKVAVNVDCVDDTQGFDGVRIYEDEAPTLRSQRSGLKVTFPVLTPDRAEKRQNGRRFKEDSEPMFTLTGQDKHGVAVQSDGNKEVYSIWYEKYQCYIAIRKLTPKECFRLQGWTDDYFEKAEFVNSNSQLYKQAGNGVTVPVIQAIAAQMRLEDLEG